MSARRSFLLFCLLAAAAPALAGESRCTVVTSTKRCVGKLVYTISSDSCRKYCESQDVDCCSWKETDQGAIECSMSDVGQAEPDLAYRGWTCDKSGTYTPNNGQSQGSDASSEKGDDDSSAVNAPLPDDPDDGATDSLEASGQLAAGQRQASNVNAEAGADNNATDVVLGIISGVLLVAVVAMAVALRRRRQQSERGAEVEEVEADAV